MFMYFTGLTMLRERPFDIYAGQEDVFWPEYFFHDTILFFYFHILHLTHIAPR